MSVIFNILKAFLLESIKIPFYCLCRFLIYPLAIFRLVFILSSFGSFFLFLYALFVGFPPHSEQMAEHVKHHEHHGHHEHHEHHDHALQETLHNNLQGQHIFLDTYLHAHPALGAFFFFLFSLFLLGVCNVSLRFLSMFVFLRDYKNFWYNFHAVFNVQQKFSFTIARLFFHTHSFIKSSVRAVFLPFKKAGTALTHALTTRLKHSPPDSFIQSLPPSTSVSTNHPTHFIEGEIVEKDEEQEAQVIYLENYRNKNPNKKKPTPW
ncbi:MAG: hypothetical protein J6P29_02600 [Acetobacter sp.]|nr:hypothetical protein [Acetobacter sp.]